MDSKKLVNLDNLDKLSKGLDARYKEMIQEESERAMLQEQVLDTKINATKDMLDGKTIRYVTQVEYDNLSDAEKNNDTIVYFITDAKDLSHEHENKDFLDNLDARNIAIGNKVQTFDGVNDLVYSISDIGAAPASHTHDDRYYTEAEANSTFAPKSHNHDDIYYTDDEVDNLLAGKSNSGHNHDDRYYTESEINTKIANLQSEIDTDVEVEKDRAEAAEAALQAAINGKAPSSHTHDDRYYTESEMNTKLATKADTDHGTHVPTPQTANNAKFLRNDNSWQTVTPANIGAAPSSHNHNDSYYTKTEINTEIDDINETITTKEAALNAAINGKAATVHGNHASYGTCSTAAATAEKAVSVAANFSLTVGAIVAVKFTNSNTASNVTINVNSTGAKSIWYNTAAYTGNDKNVTGNAGRITTYMYDGTYWVWISNGVDNNTTYTNASLGQGYATCDTAAATAAKVASLSSYSLSTGGMVAVKFTYNVPANATLNINSKGAKSIYYRGAAITADIIKAGDIATFMYNGSQYHLISIDRWQNDLTSHNHDGRYYTESEIDTKVSTINDTMDRHVATLNAAIAGKAPSSHTHDDRYYTESEINTKLAAKADSSHGNHVPATQTASNKTFLRNDNTWATVTPANIGAAPSSHDHDDRYYTESEINTKIEDINTTITTNVSTLTTEVNKKLNKSDHGTHLALGTTSSTAFRGDYGNTAYNHSQEAHAPTNAQKNSDITKSEIEAKLTGSITSHNHTSVNKTMVTTPIYNASSGILVDFNIDEKSGAMVILKMYGNSYSTNPPIEAIYQFYDYAAGSIGNGTGSAISGPSIDLKVYRVDGKLKAWFQQPNSYSTFKLEVAYGNNASTPNVTLTNAAEPTTNITQTVTITPDRVYSKAYKPTPSDIGASASGHTHDDRYFTETEANNAFAPKSHNHDDRYYTETEMNTKIENINNTITTKEATLQAAINGKAAKSHGSHVAYGTCSTAASTAAKVVSVSDTSWELTTGCMVAIKFTTSNTAGSVTLNVNSSGAYPIWYNNAEYTGTGNAYTGYANRVTTYMFNGTHWVWIASSYDANNTYSNASLGQGYATCDTAESTVAKVGTLSSYSLTAGGVVSVKFTYNVPASATLNINSKGAKAIYFRGAAITAGIIKAGDIATFIYNGSQYQLISIDRWQNDITSHTHDGRYYTETEIDGKITTINDSITSNVATLQAAINGKAPSGHTHTSINYQDTRSVDTSPKDMPNGLSVHLKSNGADGLTDGGTYHSTLMIKGWGDKSGGPWGQLTITQNSNLYFRSSVASSETDWNAWKKVSLDGHTHSSYQSKDNTITTVSVSGGKLTLTKDKRQKCTNITSGTEIVFPTVSNTEFLEIHLYFNAESNMSLVLPDCKWRVDPNLEAGNSYELVATWNTMNWLANLIVYS